MASRLPAIPTLPPHVDPAIKHAFAKMREVILSLLGTQGDPRDARPSAEELSSLYGRIYDLERAAQLSIYNASRAGSIAQAEVGDTAAAIGFVYASTAKVGVLAVSDGADTPAISGTVGTGGTLAADHEDDAGVISGTVT